MKQGKTLSQLAAELEARKENAKDYVAAVDRIHATTVHTPREGDQDRSEVRIALVNGEMKLFTPTRHAHGQIANYAGIPSNFYQKLSGENPELLAENINHGLDRVAHEAQLSQKKESRMIRTIGKTMTANLSSRFRRLDCVDMAEAILPDLVSGRIGNHRTCAEGMGARG